MSNKTSFVPEYRAIYRNRASSLTVLYVGDLAVIVKSTDIQTYGDAYTYLKSDARIVGIMKMGTRPKIQLHTSVKISEHHYEQVLTYKLSLLKAG